MLARRSRSWTRSLLLLSNPLFSKCSIIDPKTNSNVLLNHEAWLISIHQNDPISHLVPVEWDHINRPLSKFRMQVLQQQRSIGHQNCHNLKENMLKYMSNSIPAYLNLPVPKICMSSKLQLNFFKTVSSHLNTTLHWGLLRLPSNMETDCGY